ncbi:MAG: DUF4445 domain-containing protein [Bacteroidetes bacterium]|jgi:uncharacterized 2Fe-2S/4Fe-4S cluster protein (DUF4445 family)|nr:DUF4445 domain-containing protein [Bacteroidota bacterium]
MVTIKVLSSDQERIITSNSHESLLESLRQNGISIYAPCGGKGDCGKCLVNIKNSGRVLSCQYFPERDIEVILPGKDETRILVNQTSFLENYEIDIDNTEIATYNTYGVAIDLGTTTVVLYFVNLHTGEIENITSFLNPQKAFGGDVISRINYCQENSLGLNRLQNAIVTGINERFEEFCNQREIETDRLLKMAVSGNTTMLHLLLGADPVPIALYPFTPQFTDKQCKKGDQTPFKINGKADFITLPCINAYIGADIVAGLAALKPKYDQYLFIDIGTNGEMALLADGKIYVCATAAGPAFEGANIQCGMGALRGAISTYTNPDDYSVIGNILPVGICGSGIIDIVAYMLKNHIIDETGLMDKNFVVHKENDIYIAQDDIRQIQLAKSAIYSGLKLLLKYAGLNYQSINQLFLAGGFGNYINIDSAITIGLLPAEMKGKIHPIGNSAGIGSLQYLKSKIFMQKADSIIQHSIPVELSEDEDFAPEFALNMNFSL